MKREGSLSGNSGPVQVIGFDEGVKGQFMCLIALGQENKQIVGNI